MDTKQVINEIKSFLDGRNDDLKYLVNVETDRETNKAICVFHEPEKEKRIEQVEYTPFLYMKDLKKCGRVLFNGDKEFTVAMMKKHGVKIKRMKTGNHPRLENGYPYKVTSTKSFQHILDFFKDGGLDPYEKIYDEGGSFVKDKKTGRPLLKNFDLFYMIKTNEQFFISTGARLFKGIEEYKDLHRLTFDIETTGLRYEHERIFAIGVKDNRGFETTLEVTKDDDDDAEIRLIQDFFNLISYLKPAVIVGYNSEEFDFQFILGRAKEILKIDITKLPTTLSEEKNIWKKHNSTVKFGNSTEKYAATVMWGYTVLDILHAVKKTAAVNTDIKNARLKYICQYEGIAKPNRMYIDGEKIGYYWNSGVVSMINPVNNKYIDIPEKWNTLANNLLLIQNKKENGSLDDNSYNYAKKQILSSDKTFVEWLRDNSKKLINEKSTELRFISGRDILRRYLLDDLWETEKVDDRYNQSSFLLAKIVPTTYTRIATMGNAAVWNLLMITWSFENDLAIPHPDSIENFSGGLTRCYKKGWTQRIVKIDFASLYPMIQLTDDVFPLFDITGVIKKMLMYMTTTRNIYKKLANADTLKEEEVELLQAIDHETYEKYVNNSFTDDERKVYKTKQLPIKILNNSLFGALGSGYAFNWSDNTCAARITCTGRIELRHAISWFKNFGLVPLLAVTDGVNFGIPDTTTIRVTDKGVFYNQEEHSIEEMWKYNGKVGVGALIEKFNAEEMKPPFMSVDNDGEFVSCLNLSRINYALAVDVKDKKTGEIKRKVKLTGNTIKSKTMPEYIEEFVDNGLKLILDGKGVEFVNYYHDYAEKIFYKQIPLKKIASKSKMKSSLKDYMNRGTDKNGKVKARQAHMELIIEERKKIAREIFFDRFNELNDGNDKAYDEYSTEEIMKLVETYMPPEPPLDSMIYYVNNGTRKSHGDVKSEKFTNEKGEEETRIKINANLISQEDLENNPDLTGEYNVDKYLDAFNKRVTVLLDGFDEEIRNDILVKIVRKKKKDSDGKKIEVVELEKNQFTSDQLQLKNFDHDDFESSMFLEEKELDFWNKTGYNPFKVWDGFSRNDDDLHLDTYQFALDFVSQKMIKVGKSAVKSVNDKLDKGDYLLIKNNNNYSLGYHNGDFVEILREKVDIPLSPHEQKLLDEQLKKQEELSKKLKVDSDNIIDDELKNKIQIKNKEKEYFEMFKTEYGIDEKVGFNVNMDELFNQYPELREVLLDYIKNKEQKYSPDQYGHYDDGEY